MITDGTGELLNSKDDEPAILNHKIAVWYNSGLIHRDQGCGPAEIDFHRNRFTFYNLGGRHRTDGPAIVHLLAPANNLYYFRDRQIPMKQILEYDLHKPVWNDADITLFAMLCS